jgi:hypothetical protein
MFDSHLWVYFLLLVPLYSANSFRYTSSLATHNHNDHTTQGCSSPASYYANYPFITYEA